MSLPIPEPPDLPFTVKIFRFLQKLFPNKDTAALHTLAQWIAIALLAYACHGSYSFISNILSNSPVIAATPTSSPIPTNTIF